MIILGIIKHSSSLKLRLTLNAIPDPWQNTIQNLFRNNALLLIMIINTMPILRATIIADLIFQINTPVGRETIHRQLTETFVRYHSRVKYHLNGLSVPRRAAADFLIRWIHCRFLALCVPHFGANYTRFAHVSQLTTPETTQGERGSFKILDRIHSNDFDFGTVRAPSQRGIGIDRKRWRLTFIVDFCNAHLHTVLQKQFHTHLHLRTLRRIRLRHLDDIIRIDGAVTSIKRAFRQFFAGRFAEHRRVQTWQMSTAAQDELHCTFSVE
mmetsp:Transcript_20907/g.31857  ORF Transcript_20907/g.31857 Transcript_20907/m.31857 type:complete len:268 (+) Transcript_20907:344-1147(+)